MNRRQFLFFLRAWQLLPLTSGVSTRALARDVLNQSERRFRPSIAGETWADFVAWADFQIEEMLPSEQMEQEAIARAQNAGMARRAARKGRYIQPPEE